MAKVKDRLTDILNKYVDLLEDEENATQDEKDMLKFMTDHSADHDKETALRHFFAVVSALVEIEKL